MNLNKYLFPVRTGPGFSTYLRIRFRFDKHLPAHVYQLMRETFERWYENCTKGEYEQGRAYEILSYRILYKYMRPIFEIDFDIAKADPIFVEWLFGEVDKIYMHLKDSIKIEYAHVGYFNPTEWMEP